jgi:hypothetical protein
MTRAKKGTLYRNHFPRQVGTGVQSAAFVKTQSWAPPRPPNPMERRSPGQRELPPSLLHCDERWYAAYPERAAGAPAPRPPHWTFQRDRGRRERLVAVQPSTRHTVVEQRCITIPPREAAVARPRTGGPCVDAARVSWVDETDVERTIDRCMGRRRDVRGGRQSAGHRALHARAGVNRARTGSALQTEGAVQLWRERSFDVVLGNRWVTGTFDLGGGAIQR